MKKIKIQTGDYVLMDDDIYTNFSNYEWNLSSDYNIRASVGCFEFMLSRIVMNCTSGDGATVKYKNGNPLDCRRENLFLIHKDKKKPCTILKTNHTRHINSTNQRRSSWNTNS